MYEVHVIASGKKFRVESETRVIEYLKNNEENEDVNLEVFEVVEAKKKGDEPKLKKITLKDVAKK